MAGCIFTYAPQVSSPGRLAKGIREGVANAILIKLNYERTYNTTSKEEKGIKGLDKVPILIYTGRIEGGVNN